MEKLAHRKYFEELNDIFQENKKDLDKALIKHFRDFKYMNVTEINSFMVLVKFDNGKSVNKMDIEFFKEIYTIEQRYLEKDGKYFLIFMGNKNNSSFCTGADLKFFFKVKESSSNFLIFANLANYYFYKMNSSWKERTLFIWNGTVMGGGLGLSNSSKFRIATESTLLAMPESKFGFFANCFFNHFISKILTNRMEAIHMALFSHVYKSYEAYIKNFATHFILNKYLEELISKLKELEIFDFNKVKTILETLQTKSKSEYELEIDNYKLNIKEFDFFIKKVYSFDFPINNDGQNFEKFLKALKLNLSRFPQGSRYLKQLDSRSLLSLNINYNNALTSYNNYPFEYYFDLDVYNAYAISETGDMEEGIRAFFVDKDMAPKWKSKF
jgi:3-hydroxyisobutyryl-CoA hydrolase